MEDIGIDMQTGEVVIGHALPGVKRTYIRSTFKVKKADALLRLSQHIAEVVGFTSNFTFQCPLEFDSIFLSLCWLVTITNQSDSKTSIVIVQAFDNSDNKKSFASGFPVIEDFNGTSLGLPLVLDGGEAHQYLIRVPIRVPEAVATLAAKMPQGSSLKALQHALLESNLDFVATKST
jgi:hypothetical protein